MRELFGFVAVIAGIILLCVVGITCLTVGMFDFHVPSVDDFTDAEIQEHVTRYGLNDGCLVKVMHAGKTRGVESAAYLVFLTDEKKLDNCLFHFISLRDKDGYKLEYRCSRADLKNRSVPKFLEAPNWWVPLTSTGEEVLYFSRKNSVVWVMASRNTGMWYVYEFP